MVPMLSSVLTTCAVFSPADLPQRHGWGALLRPGHGRSITLFVAYGFPSRYLAVYYRWWYSRQQAFRPTPWLAFFSFDRVTTETTPS